MRLSQWLADFSKALVMFLMTLVARELAKLNQLAAAGFSDRVGCITTSMTTRKADTLLHVPPP